ncbi:type IX secretion system protein PorD [Neptunitalea lumnitzerae]|uniref:DUF4835 domain-containing protein n=1 Tax=Neptunitalea lumnitzerae TaxID=2965509 RepID=A0ABQ5MK31_9FLAO|nr:DUF4835 family protein [Neptunitalea sp. Y10]GLB49743.1 DUF4835 domain-containing protein [Neptunitalea sp. Y10]
MRNWILLVFICITGVIKAQELNCKITVNSQKISQTNQQVFSTLETALNEFMNNRKWTNKTYKPEERIDCNMLITVDSYENNNFSATIQVQSSRPVYNSSYITPVLNINDKQFSFTYQEFEPLYYNENRFESNLTSVMAFYAYVIIGVDADTFKMRGGTMFFNQAKKVVNIAQSGNNVGWKQNDGNRTRFELIDNLLSNFYREYRTVMYNYHLKGMDLMSSKPEMAKKTIASSIQLFKSMNARRPNSYLLQAFFDAKADEVSQIYSGGPQINTTQLVATLNNIMPNYSGSWKKIE